MTTKEPDFTVMGRGALVRHCKRLRDVLQAAEVHRWATACDFAKIEAWEKAAEQALNSSASVE